MSLYAVPSLVISPTASPFFRELVIRITADRPTENQERSRILDRSVTFYVGDVYSLNIIHLHPINVHISQIKSITYPTII